MEHKRLVFSVKDKLNGEDISPENVSVHFLEEYMHEVAVFLRGDGRTDLKSIKARIIEGSFAVEIEDETGTIDGALSDYRLLRQGVYEGVDRKRIDIFLEWQQRAQRNENLKYFLSDPEANTTISIDSNSTYEKPQAVWVNVEESHYGVIFDMGGKSKTNVHLQLEDGTSLTVGAKVKQLLKDSKNRLYKKQLVSISGKRNVETNELKDEQLIGFEEYEPHYDEDVLEELIAEGSVAWADVRSPSLWVEELRGNT